MFHSKKFLAALRGTPQQEDAIAEVMTRHARHIPEEMVQELCSGVLEQTPQEEWAQKLADIVDLLHQQYDEVADPLVEADWRVLRDMIDSYAEDLSLDLIQYVMERVVDHKAL